MAKVRKNKNDRPGWIVDYYDLHGCRIRKVVFCSRQEAEMIANEIEAKKSRIILGLESEINSNLILADAIKYYFKHKHINANTIKREKQVFNNLMRFIGNIRLRHINNTMIDEYLRKRREEDKIKDATLGIEFRTLRSFFNYYVDHDFISESPMKKMKHPKVKEKKIRFLTESEISQLLSVVDSPNYHDLILMYLNTGARREELLQERFAWEDVDFNSKNITLLGKGGKSRTIPLNDTAYEILHRRYYVENLKIPFSQNYEYMFKKIAKYYKKAGIENANIHTFRRTFGSTLAQKKLDIFTISKLMGHSSVKVTERHYIELLNEDLRKGIKLLDS